MKTKLKLGKTLVLVLLLVPSIFSFSQSYQDSLKKDDQDIVASIAPYPADVREAILNVSQYPQQIVKIERIQARTSQSFQDRMAPYTREEQEKYYELARYPALIHQLVTGPPKTLEQVKPDLTSYPKDVSDAVVALFPMHLADLQAMDKIYQTSQEGLNKITESLPADAQADFKKIIGMPEVMSLLTERIDLVVSLGEAYKNDPSGTKEKLDAQSAEINAQNEKDLDEYKKQVESDPQMQEEMKKSSQEFADSYSANDEDQGPSDAVLNQGQAQPTVVNNYYGTNYNPNPYPYWFGYPYWYSSPMWYPYPLYYQTGFYVGVGGGLVVVGLPSRAYSGWFFNYGYRRYPHYYNYCNNFYSVHRTYVNHTSVYRGFHGTMNRHFSSAKREGNVNRSSNHINNNNNNNTRSSTVNHTSTTNRNVAPAHNPTNFRNSINTNRNNFNQRSFSNFHATQFHQQSWSGVRGGTGGSHVGGGARPSGGGHAGGGGHGRR